MYLVFLLSLMRSQVYRMSLRTLLCLRNVFRKLTTLCVFILHTQGPREVERREVELDPQESPGEIKSREMELGSHRELDNPLLQLFLNSCFADTVFVTFLNSCFADTVFVTLLRTAV